MEKRASIAVDQYAGGLDTFFYDFIDFCVGSFTTCFSRDAGKLCVPVGLSAVSALLLVLSCCLLVHQRCRRRRENPATSILYFYCFIGDLCSTVGAILSKQLHIQILVGAFAAAVDAVHIMSCCFPLFLCWNSKTERRRRMLRKRRRQHLLAVCILMIIAGGLLKSRSVRSPTDRSYVGRRLLHVSLQDNTEIVGYILGVLSFFITCTFRLPSLCRACRHQSVTWASVMSGLLCSVAGALYAAAILLYDTHLDFLLRVGPWLLSAGCCVALDVLTLLIHWCKWMSGTRHNPGRFSSDTECLLGNAGIITEEKVDARNDTKEKKHSSEHTKNKNATNTTEMGRYMDVSSHPARKIFLKEVTVSKKDGVDFFPDRTVRIIRVNSYVSSDTSCDSTPVSSDLEWDFEDAQWRESAAKKLNGDKFPLREWPKNPRPPNTCVMSEHSQKNLLGTKEGGIV